MKKKYLTICFTIFCLLLLATESSAFKGQFYRNEEHFFAITFPNDWSIERGKNPHVVVKSLDETRTSSVSVTVAKLPDKYRDAKVTDVFSKHDFIKKYKLSGLGVKLLDSGITSFWSEEALWGMYILSIKHLGQTIYTLNLQIITLHWGNMYSLQFGVGDNSADSVYRKYEENKFLFNQVLTSFRFDDWNR